MRNYVMRYSEDTIYICGSGKTAETNPITQTQSLLVISLVIRKSDGMVLSAKLNSSCRNTSDFVASVLEGRNFYDIDEIIRALQTRYFGTSRKTITIALRDAYDKLGSRARSFYPDLPPCRGRN